MPEGRAGLLLFWGVFCFFLVLGNSLVVNGQRRQQQDVELTASSQFNLVLGPISDRLGLDDIQVVEETTALVLSSLVEELGGGGGEEVTTEYLNIEAVVQESDFLISQQPSSQIRFFVLATTVTQAETLRVELNRLIEETLFGSDLGRETFLAALRSSNRTLLSNVSTVKVSPLVPPASPSMPLSSSANEPNNKELSSTDIILISVCGLIFLGICFMVVQHINDRGYLENQRVLVANQRILGTASQAIEDETSSAAQGSIYISASEDGASGGRLATSTGLETPSTPSTIHSAELRAQLPSSTPEKRISPRKLQMATNDTPSKRRGEGLVLMGSSGSGSVAPSLGSGGDGGESSSIYSVMETLESQWFDSITSTTHKCENKESNSIRRGNGKGGYSDDGETKVMVDGNTMIGEARDTLSISSDESEDVFFVDVENASINMVGSRNNKKRSDSYHSTDITEWMKTIRVVRTPSPLIVGGNMSVVGGGGCSDTKTSDMTPSSHEGTSLSSSGEERPTSSVGITSEGDATPLEEPEGNLVVQTSMTISSKIVVEDDDDDDDATSTSSPLPPLGPSSSSSVQPPSRNERETRVEV